MPAFSLYRSSDGLVVPVVLEEGLVGAHHLGVLVQALPHAGAQPDDALHAVGRQEGVAEDLLGLLPDAIHAARPLDQADDGPRQVVVDDDGAVLEVLAFAQDIGGDSTRSSSVGADLVALLVALRAEAPGQAGRVSASRR